MSSLGVKRSGTVAIAGAVVLAMTFACARDARADLELQVAGAAGGAWIRSLPELKSAEVTTSARFPLRESKIAGGGSVVGLGASFDTSLTIDDRVLVPLFGIGAYGAVGNYDTILTSVDGSVASLRPWTTMRLDVLLPGIGYRVKKRRWMFAADVRAGIAFYTMAGSVAGAVEWQSLDLSAVNLVVQAEIEGCRRLDPITRLCAFVAPRVYDGVMLNGATFGLRVEWGR